MLTSFSANSVSSRWRCCPSPSRLRRSPGPRGPWLRVLCVRAIGTSSEFQAALAGGIGQGLDPAMIEIGTAVEDNARDPGRLGALRDQLADGAGCIPVCARFQVRLDGGVEGRGGSQGSPGRIIDDLGINVPRRAKHRQPQAALGGLPQLVADPLAPAPEQEIGIVRHDFFLRGYFFLPSFRRITSSAYLMPLPL